MGKARKKRYNPQKILRIGGDALVGWRALALLVMDDAMWEGYYLHNRGGDAMAEKRREAARKYYQAHREEILARNKAKYWGDPEAGRRRLKEWRSRKKGKAT